MFGAWHIHHPSARHPARRAKLTAMSDSARMAAVLATLPLVEENMIIGLGSGRAVFALTDAIGEKWDGRPPVKAVVASSTTAKRAEEAGFSVIDLNDVDALDIAFDGADEVDSDLAVIKGGGAALLREKLVIACAKRTVLMAEDNKKVDRLGQTRLLPVEIVRFGWETTRKRVLHMVDDAQLRIDEHHQPVITDEGHLLLDVPVPSGDITELAQALKATLGVVEHGLFINMATDVVLGHDDGSATTLQR
jgi:ribose 5-phosphate isomerase A